MQRHTFYVTFNECRRSKPKPAFQIMPPTPNLETSYSILVWPSVANRFLTPNAISHYRRMCSSLAMRSSLLLISKYDITVQTNGFIAIATDKRGLCWRWTFLALDTHTFRAGGDEHFIAWDEHVKNACSNFRHTHSQLLATSKQNLCALSGWGDPKVM